MRARDAAAFDAAGNWRYHLHAVIARIGATRSADKLRPGVLPRVLIVSHDVVGRRMAGPGIRAWHMAGVLAAAQPVTLIAPRPIDLPALECRYGAYRWGDAASLAPWLGVADVVVANGFVLEAHPELARVALPLALDLYDPVLLENLELLRGAPAARRAERAAQDRALLARQLAAGDFFLCATERQRDLYLGALMLAGRLTPTLTDADPRARRLIDVAPFGLPDQPPARQGPALREVIAGIGAADPLLLWTGGLWDWLDPITLIEAMPRVAARHPRARLVFLAGRHPGTIAEMRVPELARARAAALGLLGHQVFFYDEWVPYERRGDVLLEATIAVSLHHDHLETAYAAVRSRFLDHLWAGLPSVVSGGDAAAELVERHDLGLVVPPGDAEATARALIAALDDPPRRARWAANARALARDYTWKRTLAPLARFCRDPRPTRPPQLVGSPAAQPTQSSGDPEETMQSERQQRISEMERHWQLDVPPAHGLRGLALRLALRLLAPVLAEQRAFNAATVRMIYELNAQLTAQLNAVMAQVVGLQGALQAQQRDLGDRIVDLNDHLARLTNAAQRLDDAVAEADRIQAELAEQIALSRMAADDLWPGAGSHG